MRGRGGGQSERAAQHHAAAVGGPVLRDRGVRARPPRLSATLGARRYVVTNEGWQTLSQVVIGVAILLTALGGYGAYVFGKRVEREREARAAYSGQLRANAETLLSGANHVWPKLEFGDSGAILMYTGPEGSPLFKIGEETGLTIVRESGQVKLSTIIRDQNGRAVAELMRNEWKVNPHNSRDRNYAADTLEVKDPAGDVVLQVRALPNRIQLQAKFYDASGRGVGFGKIRGPDGQWGGGIELTGSAHPQLTLRIPPLFKYPSDRHLGELIDASRTAR